MLCLGVERREVELNSHQELRLAMERLDKTHLIHLGDTYSSFFVMNTKKGLKIHLSDFNVISSHCLKSPGRAEF